ncbi:MAG: PLP-dependent aminotransferase family protein [Clostridia bacterium]|nr:PLP-dependent aminotransferase family protein [Clostridia bacterium]
MKEKKYNVIYHKVKDKILSGEYKAGSKLPSKRVMSDLTGFSQITVATAYDTLASEGYIVSRERSGYYVCEIDGFVKEKHPNYNLSLLPEEDIVEEVGLETSVWFKTIRKVLTDRDEKLFVKSPNKGCAVLRNAISEYLYRYRGMIAEPRRIIIGSGAEQLYESVVKILGRDKVFGIENPGYGQIKAVYEGEGVKVQQLNLGEDGIDSAELDKEFDVLHVTPFNSYPTGVTTSVSKRYIYLKWAKEGKYIVEDDFDSEFFLPGHPIESLYSLDKEQRVVYINTFSKSLSPSMRMGYMILPEVLLSVYEEKLGKYSCTVPVLDQYVLAEFISSGNFERHLNRVRRRMKR